MLLDSDYLSLTDEAKQVVFVPNGDKKMTHHPVGPGTESHWAPDIIGVFGPLSNWKVPDAGPKQSKKSNAHLVQDVNSTTTGEPLYRRVPYPKARTVIEMKTQGDDGLNQGITYAWYTLEASPNLCGIYVLAARPQDYQIEWVDASGASTSVKFGWTSLRPLAQYLYSLHVPPAGHFLDDPTISVKVDSKTDKTRWDISMSNDVYKNCTMTFWCGSWGRRTAVFETSGNLSLSKVIIKDMYRDDSRRYKENVLLDRIHSSGIVPGVVRILAAEDVSVGSKSLTTSGVPDMGVRVVNRTKSRLAMGSRGVHLRQAKYLSHLIKAIYDTVEGEYSDRDLSCSLSY